MSDKEMPKEVSIMGGCPVPNLCSPLLFLAELEAEGKAKKARLRAQQRGRVAKGKKGRLRGIVRYVRDNCFAFNVCRPSLRPYSPGEIYRTEPPGGTKQQDQSDCPMPPVPPKKEKG